MQLGVGRLATRAFPQPLSTEYRSRRDSPEESNMHNCISWVHFKWQSCEASHLCMHLITHSQTLKSPVPQVSESRQCLLVRTQSWRPSNSPPKFWWDTPGDRQPYHRFFFFLHHSTETLADECIKCTPLNLLWSCLLSLFSSHSSLSPPAASFMVIDSPEEGQTAERRFTYPLLYSAKKQLFRSIMAQGVPAALGAWREDIAFFAGFVFNSLPRLILNSSHYGNCEVPCSLGH